jgi:hypothetical protein
MYEMGFQLTSVELILTLLEASDENLCPIGKACTACNYKLKHLVSNQSICRYIHQIVAQFEFEYTDSVSDRVKLDYAIEKYQILPRR